MLHPFVFGTIAQSGAPTYVGLGDIANFTTGYSVSQPLTADYYFSGNTAVSYRNGTTGATGVLGWIDGKFDEDGWDIASNNGTEILYVTSLDDQISTNDAYQLTATWQPTLLRTGRYAFDGSTHKLLSSIGDPINNLSIFTRVKFDAFLSQQNICTQDDVGSNRKWILQYHQTNQLRFLAFIGGVPKVSYLANASTILGTTERSLCVRYDSVNGVKIGIDGVPQTVLNNFTGSIDSKTVDMGIGGFSSGVLATLDGQKAVDMMSVSETWTDQQCLDLHNQFEANDAA